MKNVLLFASLCVTFYTQPIVCNELTLEDYYKTAKENCDNISEIRTQIDRINVEILRLLTERTAYVKRAGDLKAYTTKTATDSQRVADQEQSLISKSKELGLPSQITIPTFRSLVNASIEYEQEYINQLNASN